MRRASARLLAIACAWSSAAAGCPAGDDVDRTSAATTVASATVGSGDATAGTGDGSTAGAATSDAGGSEAADPSACSDRSECRLHSDCCTCDALAVGETPPACDLTCERDLCEQWGITEILCSHTCLLRLQDCDPGLVQCADAPPSCEPGFVATVVDRCWTRHCVPEALCTPS
ncbi:MAG: hypothetical protein U0168_18070 [Nannocystaceae bacterium]